MTGQCRRSILAALAAGASGSTTGCLDRLSGVVGSSPARQVSLTVKAPADDDDPYADGIAQAVASWFRTAGMSVSVSSLAPSELRTQVLEAHEFDLFVSRVPGRYRDPDALHSLLHSRYAPASGWNNPFGVTSEMLDDQLASQRRPSSRDREAVITDLAATVAELEPFTVVCVPEGIRTARRDRFVGFSDASLQDPSGFLALGHASADADGSDGNGDSSAEALHLASTDEMATETLNPLSTIEDAPAAITGLVYDSLARRVDDGVTPWLAEEWTITEGDGAPRATVRLRQDAVWHDGEPVSADDVAFTYAFLADVRLADGADPVAVPRFRDRTSLVEEAAAVDDGTAVIEFVDCDPEIVPRALTVPILPAHIWRDRVEPASDGDQDRSNVDPLQTNNVPPVGSGPLSFAANVPGERLVLHRNDDHFLADDDLPEVSERFEGRPVFDRLVLEVTGTDRTAVELVASGQADATFTPLSPETVPRVARAADLRLYTDEADAFYVVGYNTRREQLSNTRFREVLGGLIDQAALVRSTFEGYATPAASPLAGTPWLPDELEWDGGDPVTPFLGSHGDLDVERARDAFRDIGYRYEDDALVAP